MNDASETKKAKTIIENIRKLLFNCDLTVVYANGEIVLREVTMRLNEGSRAKAKQRKFINAKIDKERYEVFIADIENTKNEIMDNLNLLLDKYQPRYKEVFVAYFLQDKTYQEIATQTNYSKEAIKVIVRRLKTDLLTFYIP
jgi:RNA polymerase sigma factor (sigma-70 family)